MAAEGNWLHRTKVSDLGGGYVFSEISHLSRQM
jgi:hypothetical protein